jgi:hypothetical protein
LSLTDQMQKELTSSASGYTNSLGPSLSNCSHKLQTFCRHSSLRLNAVPAGCVGTSYWYLVSSSCAVELALATRRTDFDWPSQANGPLTIIHNVSPCWGTLLCKAPKADKLIYQTNW